MEQQEGSQTPGSGDPAYFHVCGTISKNADNKITKTKVPKLFKSDDGKIKRVIKAVDSLHTSVSEEKKYVGYCSNFLSRVTLYLLGS